MNKFLKSIVVFIPFVIILYVVMICIWGSIFPPSLNKNLNYMIGLHGHSLTRLKEAKKIKNIDILFIGSSHAYRGFDVRIFEKAGFSSFNLGTSSQTPLQTEILLKRYLKSINPKLIIYEVFPSTFCVDGIESSLDLISNDKNDKLSLGLAISQKHIAVFNTLIYGYYSDFFNKNSKVTESKVKNNDTYISGGYTEHKMQYGKKIKYELSKWKANPKQYEAFLRIIKFIDANGIRKILVQAPYPSSLYQSTTNNDFFDKQMKKNGPYYNYNEKLMLNDSLHFYDSNHLNQKGVAIFNTELIKILPKLR